ncbi:MAG: exo-alpha-sialidase [Bryobacterales bacterium]|nr:exo-alpha-sialidase [Bryobacterales bacterium]
MWNRRQFNRMAAGSAALLGAGGALAPGQSNPPRVIKHLEVFRETGRYAGWPANHGAWQWGNELLFGFEIGAFKETEQGHAIDYSQPAEHVLARSLDGGENWSIERPASLQPPAGARVAGVPTGETGKQPESCPGGIDFMSRGFAFTARMLDINEGPSRFYYSLDKGKTWEGPFKLETPELKAIAARTDYVILGKHEMLLLVTVPKADGKEGRPMVLRTADGGATWTSISKIGEEPEPGDYSIMPSTLRLSSQSLYTAVRHRASIETFESQDLGKSWRSLGLAVVSNGGNPPSMVRTLTSQMVLTYGFRRKPYGIRAQISEDFGKTWGQELRLRTDGGGWDLGYVRTFLRSDNQLVSVYYYNDAKSPERYIAATIWSPGDYGYRIMDRTYNRERDKPLPPSQKGN